MKHPTDDVFVLHRFDFQFLGFQSQARNHKTTTRLQCQKKCLDRRKEEIRAMVRIIAESNRQFKTQNQGKWTRDQLFKRGETAPRKDH